MNDDQSRAGERPSSASAESARIYHCPVEVAIEVVGGRWKPLILWHLDEHGVLRHGQLRRLIPNITQKVLTQHLRQLEGDGIVTRTQYDEVPPRVDYRLTTYGAGLQQQLELLCDWGAAHAERANLTITKPDTGLDSPSARHTSA